MIKVNEKLRERHARAEERGGEPFSIEGLRSSRRLMSKVFRRQKRPSTWDEK